MLLAEHEDEYARAMAQLPDGHTQNLPPFIRDYPGVDLQFLPPHLAWAIPYGQNSGPIWWTAGRNIWQPITIIGPSVHA